jgi:hypothetical protein
MKKSDINKYLNIKNVQSMIVGNDLDALLSACLLKSRFDWDINGIYDYKSLWYNSGLAKNELLKNLKSKQYLAVDLDIYRNYLPSIGHHILSLSKNDILPQHENTLNPNLLFDISHEKFNIKYPMGSAHFLMWLLNDYPSLTRLGELLLWIADSTFINAQSHRFRNNVKDWLENYVQNRILKHGFDEVDSELFEKDVLHIAFPELDKTGLAKGKGQVRSKYNKLQGYQCQWKNPNHSRRNILSLLNLIEKNTGWKKPELPLNFECIQGKRYSYKFTEKENKQPEFLRSFLADKKAFSYVITNKFLLNYTTQIDF